MTGRQLTLDFAFEPGLDENDFLVSQFNVEAFRLIGRWPDWPDRVLLVIGPEGSGKSHLATIWQTRSRAVPVAAAMLRAQGAASLDALVRAGGALLLEDADRIGLDRTGEAGFFHLLNLARERGADLLVTGRAGPERWGIATADLVSRLRLAPRADLGVPDDALYRAVLAKLLHDRQLDADPGVIEYLLQRSERSFAAAQRIATLLDTHSLLRRRRSITRQIAAEALSDFNARRDGRGPPDRSKPV